MKVLLTPKTAKARGRGGKKPIVVTVEQEDDSSIFVRFSHIKYWVWVKKKGDPNWDISQTSEC